MPFKAKAACRRHIPKQQHRVINWAVYDAGLRARGSLTVWFTAKAMEAWRAEPRTGRGGQLRYFSLAIMTALTLRAVFRLALRQTEGLIGSVLQLLGLDLPVAPPIRRPAPDANQPDPCNKVPESGECQLNGEQYGNGLEIFAFTAPDQRDRAAGYRCGPEYRKRCLGQCRIWVAYRGWWMDSFRFVFTSRERRKSAFVYCAGLQVAVAYNPDAAQGR